MENYEVSTRPNLAFPVGLALLLFLLLSISAFFLCCLHWDRLRALIFSSVEDNPADQIQPELDQKPALPNMVHKLIWYILFFSLFYFLKKMKGCDLIGFCFLV